MNGGGPTAARPRPVTGTAFVERLECSVISLGYAVAAAPALALAILTVLCLALSVITVGVFLSLAVVPATQALTGVHRRVTGRLLGDEIPAAYVDTTGTNVVTRPVRWLTDGARWRDVAFLWFSATGGFAISLVPPALLVAPLVHLTGALLDGGVLWWILVCLDGPLLFVWWLVTPPLVRARLAAERAILDGTRVDLLERRVEQVATSRGAALDHSAAEVRRIERDLHDGAQARLAAVSMSVGLAEKLIGDDPELAAELLRDARATTTAALEDLRSVVRGIRPPVLADRGLAGGIEALALQIPLPVTVSLDLPEDLPEPVESAVYFAVAELLANAVKHSGAARAWVTARHDASRLEVVVGDDGRGAADPSGHGLTGVDQRLGAFDGHLVIDSPETGTTTATIVVPWTTT